MFDHMEKLAADPLLGLIQRYQQDLNPHKIDLGVGVYRDNKGETPVLGCVKRAERQLLEQEQSKSYVGPLGNIGFNRRIMELTFGNASCIQDGRMQAMQTTGGCGALRVAAELIKRANKYTKIWVSDPTWANHIPLLGNAGIKIDTYPYYDYQANSVNFDQMISSLEKASAGDIVLLHGCCHNPSGADLAPSQWQVLTELMLKNSLIPFVDIAYLGFGKSLEEDAFGARLIAEKFDDALFAISCSKNFGLYRERAGALVCLASNTEYANVAISQMTNIVRGIYSMPPSHGASIVELILSNPDYITLWQTELTQMRERLNKTRQAVVNGLTDNLKERFSFLISQLGMFSFLGITQTQVNRLADEYGIYMADTSRICLAGLNDTNTEYFCSAMSEILR